MPLGKWFTGLLSILEDLLETALAGKQDCVDKAIAMIEDLQLRGSNCRLIKPLAGAVMELKARTDDVGTRAITRVGWALPTFLSNSSFTTPFTLSCFCSSLALGAKVEKAKGKGQT